MKLDVYAVPPPWVRSQFSSGVSGQTQPANSTHAPQAAAGRCTHATRAPPRGEQSAQNHEEHERRVEQNRDVGERGGRSSKPRPLAAA